MTISGVALSASTQLQSLSSKEDAGDELKGGIKYVEEVTVSQIEATTTTPITAPEAHNAYVNSGSSADKALKRRISSKC